MSEDKNLSNHKFDTSNYTKLTSYPEAKKYKEYWGAFASNKYMPMFCINPPSADEERKFIHVIDIKAYNNLKEEMKTRDIINKNLANRNADLLAQADALHFQIREVYEDYYRHIDKHDLPVTKEYTECISYLSNALKTYEKFKKGMIDD